MQKSFSQKVTFLALLFSILVSGISFSQNQGSEPFQRVEGYQLNPAKNLGSGNFAQLIFRQTLFENFFIKNPKATKVTKIDFENQTVISMTGIKAKEKRTFSIEKIVKANQRISIYFVTQKEKKSKEFLVPFCIYTMKKDSNIKGISYYLDGQLLEDVKN